MGPFFAHYNYRFDQTIIINNDGDFIANVGLEAGFSMTSVGIELGYQFVFWDRLSLDLILIGPSLSFYKAKTKLRGDLEIDDESDAYSYLHDEILERYPWLETFIDLSALKSGGSFHATSAGFRYVIQIGYRF